MASKLKIYPLFFILLLLLSGCDIFSPKKSFRLAIPEHDYSYNTSA